MNRLVPGHIDNHSVTLPLHDLVYGPATVDCSLQVHINQCREFLPIRQFCATARQNIGTGIIHPYINAAKPGSDRVEQAADAILIGHISLYGDCLSGKTLYLTNYFLSQAF